MIKPPEGRGGPQIIPRPAQSSLGGPPPWRAVPLHQRRVDLVDLERRLAAAKPKFKDRGLPETSSNSAVLIALYLEDERPMVLLTRRSREMRSHTHEVSFPGGHQEPGDTDLIATALREANEEIGLNPTSVRIIGELDRFVTVGSGSLVHPYVALLDAPPRGIKPSPREVEEILRVPVSELLRDDVWREERWQIEGRGDITVTFFELKGDTVWGATGNMLRQLLSIATGTHRR